MVFPNYSVKISPSTIFGAVDKFWGSKPPPYGGGFNRESYRDRSTEKVRHIGNGVWHYYDPERGLDFQFTQNRQGDYITTDGRLISNFGSPNFKKENQNPQGNPSWNIAREGEKIRLGIGSEDETSQYWRGDPRFDPSKKSLPLQYYLMQSGPFFNPVRPQPTPPQQNQQQNQQQASQPVVPPLETPPVVPQLPAPPTLPVATVAPPQQTPPPSQQLPPMSPSPQPHTPMGFGNMFASGLLGNAARNTYR